MNKVWWSGDQVLGTRSGDQVLGTRSGPSCHQANMKHPSFFLNPMALFWSLGPPLGVLLFNLNRKLAGQLDPECKLKSTIGVSVAVGGFAES